MSDIFSYVSHNVRLFGNQHTYHKAIGEDFVVIVQRRQMRAQTAFPVGRPLDQRSLRQQIRSSFNRAELFLLCRDLGLHLEDLSASTLENQILELIDYCHRHGMLGRLVEHVQAF